MRIMDPSLSLQMLPILQPMPLSCTLSHGSALPTYFPECGFSGTVKVEMDFLNPFIMSCKKTANDVWVQLPPPVQAGMPFFAVSAATGIFVCSIEERRLKHQASIQTPFQSPPKDILCQPPPPLLFVVQSDYLLYAMVRPSEFNCIRMQTAEW